jgi:hypothetical protein
MSRITIKNESNLDDEDALQLCSDLISSFMTNQCDIIQSRKGHRIFYDRSHINGEKLHKFTVCNKITDYSFKRVIKSIM